jgi:hypothetical protein
MVIAVALSFALIIALYPSSMIAVSAATPDLARFAGKVVSISPVSNSKLYLGLTGDARSDGADIVAAKKSKSREGQLFEIVEAGDGAYAVRSAHTGRLLTEADGKIVQSGMTSPADDSQRWAITKHSKGYTIANKATSNRLSASASGVTPVAGDGSVTDSQIFEIAVSSLELDGYYSFTTPAGNVIALSKASIKDGAFMVLKKDGKGTLGKQFFLISSPNGYHAIKNSISFKALGAKNNSRKSGVRLVQKTYKKKNKNQRFNLVPSGDGWYLLRSASGYYVSAASDTSKAKLVTVVDKAGALKVRVVKAEYSSGMPKLDAKLKKLHKKIGTKGNTMKKSFFYVANNYTHRNHPNNFKGDWISRYAWDMIRKKHGHCKNFAATVCIMFRSYGYDAQVVTGHIPSRSRGWAVHGWVEAKVKGKTYLFDADLYLQLRRSGWYKRTYKNAPVNYRVEKRW